MSIRFNSGGTRKPTVQPNITNPSRMNTRTRANLNAARVPQGFNANANINFNRMQKQTLSQHMGNANTQRGNNIMTGNNQQQQQQQHNIENVITWTKKSFEQQTQPVMITEGGTYVLDEDVDMTVGESSSSILISVETYKPVNINLNGKTLRVMRKGEFYDDFTIISVNHCGDLVIRDGIIEGNVTHLAHIRNGSTHCKLYNMSLKNFEQTGVCARSCKNLSISNCLFSSEERVHVPMRLRCLHDLMKKMPAEPSKLGAGIQSRTFQDKMRDLITRWEATYERSNSPFSLRGVDVEGCNNVNFKECGFYLHAEPEEVVGLSVLASSSSHQNQTQKNTEDEEQQQYKDDDILCDINGYVIPWQNEASSEDEMLLHRAQILRSAASLPKEFVDRCRSNTSPSTITDVIPVPGLRWRKNDEDISGDHEAASATTCIRIRNSNNIQFQDCELEKSVSMSPKTDETHNGEILARELEKLPLIRFHGDRSLGVSMSRCTEVKMIHINIKDLLSQLANASGILISECDNVHIKELHAVRIHSGDEEGVYPHEPPMSSLIFSSNTSRLLIENSVVDDMRSIAQPSITVILGDQPVSKLQI